MLIQVIKAYINYSNMGLVPEIRCGIDHEHGLMYANIDEDENVYLYCMACDYSNMLGSESYEMMRYLVEHVSSNQNEIGE